MNIDWSLYVWLRKNGRFGKRGNGAERIIKSWFVKNDRPKLDNNSRQKFQNTRIRDRNIKFLRIKRVNSAWKKQGKRNFIEWTIRD